MFSLHRWIYCEGGLILHEESQWGVQWFFGNGTSTGGTNSPSTSLELVKIKFVCWLLSKVWDSQEVHAGNSLLWNVISVQLVSVESSLLRQPFFREEDLWEDQISLLNTSCNRVCGLWIKKIRWGLLVRDIAGCLSSEVYCHSLLLHCGKGRYLYSCQ